MRGAAEVAVSGNERVSLFATGALQPRADPEQAPDLVIAAIEHVIHQSS